METHNSLYFFDAYELWRMTPDLDALSALSPHLVGVSSSLLRWRLRSRRQGDATSSNFRFARPSYRAVLM